MTKSDGVRIEAAPSPTDEVRALVGELEAALAAEYAPEQRHGLALDEIFQPHIRFFLARVGGAAVGCGGVALFSEFAEVKRMYVREAARGLGVAQAILARIEAEARDAGLRLLRLETGERQVAAIRLYTRAGFRNCPAFGAYALMAPQSVASSAFFEKRIALPAGGDIAG
jgi:putative acetyltransferase